MVLNIFCIEYFKIRVFTTLFKLQFSHNFEHQYLNSTIKNDGFDYER